MNIITCHHGCWQGRASQASASVLDFRKIPKLGKKKEILAYQILATKIKIEENKCICLSYRAICETILKELKCKFLIVK
jgi:hypothetical protein